MRFGAEHWGRAWVLGLGLCLFRWTGKHSPYYLIWVDADSDEYRDRPWQAYPITILTGAYIGYAVGSLISRSSWLYGKRIQFIPEVEENMDKKTE